MTCLKSLGLVWETRARSKADMGWLIAIILLVSLMVIGHVNARADWGGMHINWLDGWTRLICRHLHGLKSTQIALPDTGPAIVVANHVSGLDPLLLIAASQRPLRFLIASEEYHRPVLHWIFRLAGCIPVDRKGRPETALRAARRALERGEVIALFPHGKIHLDTDPPRPIKGGVIRLAVWADAPIYPVRIDGVKAQGKVFIAPFTPDKVTLTLHPSIRVNDDEPKMTIQRIVNAIEMPTVKQP